MKSDITGFKEFLLTKKKYFFKITKIVGLRKAESPSSIIVGDSFLGHASLIPFENANGGVDYILALDQGFTMHTSTVKAIREIDKNMWTVTTKNSDYRLEMIKGRLK